MQGTGAADALAAPFFVHGNGHARIVARRIDHIDVAPHYF
jgi:hypothetical protein